MSWSVRSIEEQPFGTPIYDLGSDSFSIKFYYGGKFENSTYVGGQVGYIDYCEIDKISKVELFAMLKELGCSGEKILKQNRPGVGLKRLETDKDVLEIEQFMPAEKEVEIYAEEKILGSFFVTVTPNTTGNTSKVGSQSVNKAQIDDSESDCSVEYFYDNEYDGAEDDNMFEAFIDHSVDIADHGDGAEERGIEIDSQKGKRKATVEVVEKNQSKKKKGGKIDKGKEKEVVEDNVHDIDTDLEDEDYDSDEVPLTMTKHDDENDPKWPEFNPLVDMENPKFELGMKFSNNRVFKTAVRSYGIKQGKGITFCKNEGHRVRAKCEGKRCKWMVYVSKMHLEDTLQIKSILDNHRCGRKYAKVHVKSEWLANHFLLTFRGNPKISAVEFQNKVHKKLVIDISRS